VCTNLTPTKKIQWVKDKLGDISPISMVQGDLLEPQANGENRLMKAIDGLNSRFRRGTVKVSTGGIRKEWGMRQERKSPTYTTDWAELPAV
jgi:DNA polymerase V